MKKENELTVTITETQFADAIADVLVELRNNEAELPMILTTMLVTSMLHSKLFKREETYA